MTASVDEALARARRVEARAVTAIRVALGSMALWLVLSAFIPGSVGWNELVSAVGGEGRLLAFMLGVALLFITALLKDRLNQKRALESLFDFVNLRLSGAGYREDRAAVTLLIQAVGSSTRPEVRQKAAAQLRRLTGEDHGEDAVRWQAWWAGAQHEFRSQAPR